MMSQNNLKLMIWTRTYWCIALPYNSGIRQIQSCHVRWLFQLAIPKKNQAKMEPQQHIPGHPHSPLPTWYPIPYHTKVKRLMNSTIHPRLCVAQCLHKFHVPISTGLLIQRVESGYLRFPNIWDQRSEKMFKKSGPTKQKEPSCVLWCISPISSCGKGSYLFCAGIACMEFNKSFPSRIMKKSQHPLN